MGLNTRKAQVIAVLITILSTGLVLAAPFGWRALKTKKRSDIRLAIAAAVVQVIVYVAHATDTHPKADQITNTTGAIVWLSTLLAAFAAAWVFRPLNKEERMDEARNSQQPGSTFL